MAPKGDKDGNKDLEVIGANNTAKITNNTQGKIKADQSNLFIQGNIGTQINVTANNIAIQRSRNSVIEGPNSKILLDAATNCYINGDNNSVTSSNSTNVACIGSNLYCKLDRNTNFSILGDGNKVVANGTHNGAIKGNNNSIIAANNQNMSIVGSLNKIIAINTSNLVTEGDNHNLTVKDTHGVMRFKRILTPNRQDFDNHIQFCGATTYSYVHPSGTLFSYGPLSGMLLGKVNMVDIDPTVEMNTQTPIHNVTSNTIVRYVDRCCIIGGRFIIGIYKLDVEQRKGEGTTLIKIDKSELDGHSYTCVLEGSKPPRFVLLTGSKDGLKQTLKLSGYSVSNLDEDANEPHAKFLIEMRCANCTNIE